MGEHVTLMLLVVEVPVHAAGRVHVKVYGVVPPLAVVVHVNALPVVAAPQTGVVVTTGWPPTTAVVEALAEETLLPSFATTLIV